MWFFTVISIFAYLGESHTNRYGPYASQEACEVEHARVDLLLTDGETTKLTPCVRGPAAKAHKKHG